MAKRSRFSEQDTDLSHEEFTASQRSSSPTPQLQQPRSDGSVVSPTTSSTKYSNHDEERYLQRAHSPDTNYPEALGPATRVSIQKDDGNKEAYDQSPMPALNGATSHERFSGAGTLVENHHEGAEKEAVPQKRNRKICGLPLLWAFIIGIIVIIVIILAIVLGVVFGTKKKSHHSNTTPSTFNTTLIGGSLDPKYYSTQGAFNGTGIALTSVNFGVDNSIFLFYQKYNGDIQQMINQANGNWAFVTTVATNARNATPLSAVAYIVDSVATWHLFYFDNDNILRQRTSTNQSNFQTNIWQDGPISNLNLSGYGSDDELIGMQACYWGNYYGSDKDFNDGFAVSKTHPTTGMNLWYASAPNTFSQYVWTNGDAQWNKSDTWPGFNTNAGVACYSWETNSTVLYVMMVDETDTLRVYWKDTNHNLTSTAQHPIDKWVNTSVTVPNVYAASSLGYTDWLAYQHASDYTLHGVNLTWAAENTTITVDNSTNSNSGTSTAETWAMTSNYSGIPGTHFAITGLNQASGGRQTNLFYQNVGNGILLGTRDDVEGGWSYNQVPVT